jgi:D-alanyl-D-alanine carboxypeptidase (penicillin-binding protein 5/6)
LVQELNNNRNFSEGNLSEFDIEERRRRRRQQMKRRKRQQELARKYFMVVLGLLAVFIALVVGAVRLAISAYKQSLIGYDCVAVKTESYTNKEASDIIADTLEYVATINPVTLGGKNTTPPLNAVADSNTAGLDDDVVSENGIVIDVDNEKILAQKGANERISPASMTKILTVLVAAEHINDLTDTFEITYEIENYSYVNDCSNVGFSVGEVVTIEDLFYGTILPSGADAALGLAIYVAGSQEAFVELMNEKIDELGILETSHFTNCVGIYDDNHYSTVYDMAVMLKAAYDNSFCREVLSARTYTTSSTTEHPDGITISNWFLRRIEDKDTNGEVLCAKTGFVVQSGNCAASLSVGNDDKVYICVTAHSTSSWRCIYDHVALYQKYIPS